MRWIFVSVCSFQSDPVDFDIHYAYIYIQIKEVTLQVMFLIDVSMFWSIYLSHFVASKIIKFFLQFRFDEIKFMEERVERLMVANTGQVLTMCLVFSIIFKVNPI